jgi:sialic acid synthase SpsE
MEIKIGEVSIGHNHPVCVIAEVGNNHMGDMNIAKDMIREAKIAGADIVKFQHHIPDEEISPEEPLYSWLKRTSFTIGQQQELKNYCKIEGIQYLCTPFSYGAAKELNDIDVDAFKIGSGEISDIHLIKQIAEFGKPMIISTGMCTFDKIDEIYNYFIDHNYNKNTLSESPLILLNCISEYPANYKDMNLKVISTMIQRYHSIIGHSDHTKDLVTCYVAVTLGAKLIEKHVTLDKKTQEGPDRDVSIDFLELKELVDNIRKIKLSLGKDKKLHKLEFPIKKWASRSLAVTKDLNKGDIITEEILSSKKPGSGIPAYMRNTIIGKKIKEDISAGSILSWEKVD